MYIHVVGHVLCTGNLPLHIETMLMPLQDGGLINGQCCVYRLVD